MADHTLNFRPAGPVAHAFMQDDSFVRILVGPLGSGKTSAAVVEVLRRAQMQRPGPDGVRRFRAAIIRNTFSDLRSTTIKSWEQWCPTHFGKMTMGTSPIVHHIVTPGLDMEILFVPLDKPEDVRKLLSLELSMAWIDEAREIPREILDALTGRVGRFPSAMQGGCSWSGIVLTSNPGDTEGWLYKLCENPPEGYKVFRQPSGISPEAENVANLPANYYSRIMSGKDLEWIKVYVHGEFGFVIEGRVVYPSFRDSIHVASARLLPVPGLPIGIGCDWGYSPAAVIGQQLPDGQIRALDELVPDNTGPVRFAELLTTYVRQNYPGFHVGVAVGDPAGSARGNDGRTIFEIMNSHTPWKWRPASTNEPTLRIEAVSAALSRMIDGAPGFLLSPACGVLRKGFAGGYHFKRVAAGNGATFHDVPNKNQYSHPHDALQYLTLGFGGADIVLNRDQRRRETRSRMADGLDYDLLGYDSTPSRPAVGVRFGNPPYRDMRR